MKFKFYSLYRNNILLRTMKVMSHTPEICNTSSNCMQHNLIIFKVHGSVSATGEASPQLLFSATGEAIPQLLFSFQFGGFGRGNDKKV